LIAELCLSHELGIVFNEDGNKYLATLLGLGIYTDTKSLIEASNRDRLAFSSLYPYIDLQNIKKIINYKLPRKYFMKLARSVDDMCHIGGRLVTGLGVINPEFADYLPFIADDLMRLENASLVIVWGIVNKTVRICARFSDQGFPFVKFLTENFGAGNSGAKISPDGWGEGGAIINFDLGVFMDDDKEIQAKLSEAINLKLRKMVLDF